MRFLIGLFFCAGTILSVSIAHAQTVQDVLFLKNGSIIRGQLINYSFESNTYSIKISDNSVHTFAKSVISKITKEAPSTALPTSSNMALPTAQTEPQPLVNKRRAQPLTLFPALPKSLLPEIKHDLSIGNLWHSVHTPYQNGNSELTQVARYNGVKLHYQQNHTKHLASRYGFEYATLDRFDLTSNDEKAGTINSVDKDRYSGLIVTAIASTNLQRGWRAYVGAGLYNHHYANENSKDRNYLGTRFEFGGGYMWKTLSLTLQYNWHGREQYPSDTDTIFSGGFNVSAGF
jgi:hypothetical protein